MKSKSVQIPNINWLKLIRVGVVTAVLGAVCVVGTPAKSSYAVSWGGCGSNCAGMQAPTCTIDPSFCIEDGRSTIKADTAVDAP